MKTKIKILISIIAVCIIIAVVVMGMVLVFTEPVHLVNDSSLVIDYTAGKVSADVKVTREDVKLYKSQGEGDSVTTDIGAEYDLDFRLNSTSGTTGSLDLGVFNSGQLIDKSQASTTLTFDICLSNEASRDTAVKLTYLDFFENDKNIKLTVSAVMYRTGVQDLDLGVMEYSTVGGSWNTQNGVIFNSNRQLTKLIGEGNYTGVRITCKAELVSFTEYGRLDGQFKLSLIA